MAVITPAKSARLSSSVDCALLHSHPGYPPVCGSLFGLCVPPLRPGALVSACPPFPFRCVFAFNTYGKEATTMKFTALLIVTAMLAATAVSVGGCADKTLTDAMKRLQVVKVTDIARPEPFQDNGE